MKYNNPFPDLTSFGTAFLIVCAMLILSDCKKSNPHTHAACNDGTLLNFGNCDSARANKGGVKFCYNL